MSALDDLDDLIAVIEAGCWNEIWANVPDVGLLHQNLQPMVDAYRGSLDAAKALHDALLPGWKWALGFGVTKGFASVCKPTDQPGKAVTVEHVSPARALLLATLRAYRETQP